MLEEAEPSILDVSLREHAYADLTPIKNAKEEYEQQERYVACDEHEGNLISSRVVGTEGELHIPVLDVDVPASLVPSSTEGHHHLYINVLCDWGPYVRLLEAMRDCGILEKGYVAASLARKGTYVRKPGVRKE